METTKTLRSAHEKLDVAKRIAAFILDTRLCRDEAGKPCERDLRAGIKTKMPPVFPTVLADEVRGIAALLPRRGAWALNVLRSMAGHSVVDEELVNNVHAAARYAANLVEMEIAKRERAQATAAHARQKERAEQAAAAAAKQERQSAEEQRLTAAIRALGVQELYGTPSINVLEKLLAQHRATALVWVAQAVGRVNALNLVVGEPLEEARIDEMTCEAAIRARLTELFELENSLEARKRKQEACHARFLLSQQKLAQAHDRARGKSNGARQRAAETSRTETKFETKLREIRARARAQAAAE